MTPLHRPDVVVVGAGISGLVAAYELTGGRDGHDGRAVNVTVIEAEARVGGKLLSTTVNGTIFDAAADGVLARRPEAIELCRELGLSDHLEPIAVSGASVFVRGALHPLPEDLRLGIPTSWSSLRRSGILSSRGLARAWRDVVAPRPASRGHLQDRAIGGLVEDKLGSEVVHSLVDPMLGGICAGRVAEMSAAAMFPPLLEAAQKRGGLMAALRAQTGPSVPGPSRASSELAHEVSDEGALPAFVSLRDGMHALPRALTSVLDSRGVTFLTGIHVDGLRRVSGAAPGWFVDSSATTTRADAVVIATPARSTAQLLRPLDAEAAALLDQIDYASVGVVTFVFGEDDLALPEHGTGVLVPPETPLPSGAHAGDRFLTTALTFLDRKWPHLAQPGTRALRVSIGRIDDDRMSALRDDDVVRAVLEELGMLLGPVGEPIDASVTRWVDAMPQYRVNHLMRVAGIDAAIRRIDTVAICGAAYQGLGVPACIASGRQAARSILGVLS